MTMECDRPDMGVESLGAVFGFFGLAEARSSSTGPSAGGQW